VFASSTANAEDSPHWSSTACQTCHLEAAPAAGAASINEASSEALCSNCHGGRGDAIPCRHGSGLLPGELTIPDSFSPSLENGQVVCTTCHEIVYQCQNPGRSSMLENPSFLRDRTSRKSSDYCLKCHDASGYEKLNPHAGAAGEPPGPTCLLCHANLPQANSSGGLDVEFNMEHDLNDMCRGCHAVRPHPKKMSFGGGKETDGWTHLVVPSETILEKKRSFESRTGIVLPLNPKNGEVFCGTCHNPHGFKVGGAHGSQAANMKYRLRIKNICQACHDK
jgi:hypothetical protein